MKTQRFWTGVGMFTCLVMGICIATFGGSLTRSGQIQGTVQHRGRPLTRGHVFFFSLDLDRSDHGIAVIGRSGQFVCSPKWRRDPTTATRYLVLLIPEPYPRAVVRASGSREEPHAGELAGGRSASGAGEGQTPRVMLASMRPDVMSSGPVLAGPSPEPSSNGLDNRTFELVLGPESAHIDIDLKD